MLTDDSRGKPRAHSSVVEEAPLNGSASAQPGAGNVSDVSSGGSCMPRSGTSGDAWVPGVVAAQRRPGVGPWLKPLKASRGEAVCDDALSGRVDATQLRPAESARPGSESGDGARYQSEPLCDVVHVSSFSSEHFAEMILEK